MEVTGQAATADMDHGIPRPVPLGYVLALRVVSALVALLVLVQPVTAGLFVTGRVSYLTGHAAVGGILFMLLPLQFVAAVLLWRPGRGSWWPMLFTAVELVLVVAQLATGGTRALAVHIPLGTALFGVALLFAWWACLGRGARLRRGAR
ncbi:MAG: hypothetical protein WCA46_13815 [Actinocatenispora sp.]